jgi:AcrR family transcriptional regulator
MSPKKRRTYHHGSLRDSLISEAIEVLTERSGTNFTMRELASKLGVSHSASYRHFKDKDFLLAAIATEGFKKMGEAQKRALELPKGRSSPTERLKLLGMTYIQFAFTHPAHFRVMFGAELSDKTKYPELAKAAEATFQPVVDESRSCQEHGKLRKGDPNELALILWSTVHGLSMLNIDGQIQLTGKDYHLNAEALASDLADTIIKGLRP